MITEQQFFDARIIFGGEELEGCSKLHRLALPLGLEDPILWYTRLMHDLPHLAYCWLMRFCDYVPHDREEKTFTEFKNAESRLQIFACEYYCYSRQELGNDESAIQDKADTRDGVISFHARVNWKKANPLFYNRYPRVPLLPTDEGPIDDPESEE